MKRFIGLVVFATLVFTGIGGLIDQVGARFKSDERALALLQKSRQAIGGEAALNNVRSMTIVGKTAKTFDFDGVSRTEDGEVEINFELPNRMSKMLKIGHDDGEGQADKLVERNVIVVRQGEGGNVEFKSDNGPVEGNVIKTIVLKKQDGTDEVVTENVSPVIVRRGEANTDGAKQVIVLSDGDAPNADGKRMVVRTADVKGPEGPDHALELFRTTLGLLLSAPEGLDVSYNYAGESNVDGSTCDVIDATVGGMSVKLFLDRSSSLPRMMSFTGHKPMIMAFKVTGDVKAAGETEKVFESRMPAPEQAEFQVKYSDYRAVDGIQLPFKWTQTVGGKADETVDIVSYTINPSNIAEKFKDMPTKIMLKVAKPQ